MRDRVARSLVFALTAEDEACWWHWCALAGLLSRRDRASMAFFALCSLDLADAEAVVEHALGVEVMR